MPQLDGFGLLRAIRADAALRSVPVILLSARAGEEARDRRPRRGRRRLPRQAVLRPRAARARRRAARAPQMRRSGRGGVPAAHGAVRDAAQRGAARRVPGRRRLQDARSRIRPRARCSAISRDLIGTRLRRSDPSAAGRRLRRRDRADVPPHARDRRAVLRAASASRSAPIAAITEYYEWQVNRIPLPDGGYGVVCYFRDISAHVLARTAARDGGSAEGRVPRDARARAAQSARADPQRRRSAVAHRSGRDRTRRRRSTSCSGRSRISRGSSTTCSTSRASRRAASSCNASRCKLADVIAQAVETVEPLIQEKRHELSVTTLQRAARERRSRAARAVRREPAHERGEVHRPRAARSSSSRAIDGGEAVDHGDRQRRRHPARAAAADLRPVRAERRARSTARRAASASGCPS